MAVKSDGFPENSRLIESSGFTENQRWAENRRRVESFVRKIKKNKNSKESKTKLLSHYYGLNNWSPKIGVLPKIDV